MDFCNYSLQEVQAYALIKEREPSITKIEEKKLSQPAEEKQIPSLSSSLGRIYAQEYLEVNPIKLSTLSVSSTDSQKSERIALEEELQNIWEAKKSLQLMPPELNKKDQLAQHLFQGILNKLSECNLKEQSPSIFLIYAHDGKDKLLPKADANTARTLIKWLHSILGLNLYSDQTPHGNQIISKEADILLNQLCLLPGHEQSVQYVIICGSELLKHYEQWTFYDKYCQDINDAYNRCEEKNQLYSLYNSLQQVVTDYSKQDGFHHTLTELIFLNLRINLLKEQSKQRTIIPLLLNGNSRTSLPEFITKLIIRIDEIKWRIASTWQNAEVYKNQGLHLGFIKLLERLFTGKDKLKLIQTCKQHYVTCIKLLQKNQFSQKAIDAMLNRIQQIKTPSTIEQIKDFKVSADESLVVEIQKDQEKQLIIPNSMGAFPALIEVQTKNKLVKYLFQDIVSTLTKLSLNKISPSIFLTYAHNSKDKLLPKADANTARALIKWLHSILGLNLYSDQTPHGNQIISKEADILLNQLCLLPGHEQSVQHVIICGSELLKHYEQWTLYDKYCQDINDAYNRCEEKNQLYSLYNSLQQVVIDYSKQDGFHHTLTELIFLNLRINLLKEQSKQRTIIPLLLNGNSRTSLPEFIFKLDNIIEDIKKHKPAEWQNKEVYESEGFYLGLFKVLEYLFLDKDELKDIQYCEQKYKNCITLLQKDKLEEKVDKMIEKIDQLKKEKIKHRINMFNEFIINSMNVKLDKNEETLFEEIENEGGIFKPNSV